MSAAQRSGFARLAFILSVVLSLAPPQEGLGQETGIPFDTTLVPGSCRLSLTLPHDFIVPSSLVVLLDSLELTPGSGVLRGPGKGVLEIRIPDSLCGSGTPPAGRTLKISYRYLPFSFRPEYSLRVPVGLPDTVTGRVDTVYRTAADFTSEDFFGSRLTRSGSLVRGFEAGTNRDLTLNSGFRLQMSGKLTSDLDVVAALTDENTPLQPEGTTETLQELDRIFIELRSPKAAATLGDLSLGYSSGSFGRLNRKLRGALASYADSGAGSSGRVEAGGATVRGKYVRNEFTGRDGVQGPYRLSGKNNESPVIVIAGTERVYIDGAEMVRGQLNDYTIDYGLGEITFMSGRRITFASRIAVEFEYTDRRYSRDLLGGQGSFSAGDGRWTIGGMVVQEKDDGNSLADITLTDADREILRAAGDSPAATARSGVDSVGAGNGRYELRDTLVFFPRLGVTVDTTILVFNPSDTARALYLATFTAVGADSGDYEKISTGHYRYAGPGRGRYAPLRFLPMPERHSFADVDLRGRLTDALAVTGEYAASSFDRNTFSGLGDGDNAGGAYDVGLRYGERDVAPAGIGLRSIGAGFRQRWTGARFVPLDRYNTIEFERDWNAAAPPGAGELLRESDLSVSPFGDLTLGGYAGELKRGPEFSSRRTGASVGLAGTGGYAFEFLRSRDGSTGRRTERRRHDGNAMARVGGALSRLVVRSERSVVMGADSTAAGPESYSFVEISPGISFDTLAGMRLTAGVTFRMDDSVAGGVLVPASRSLFQNYGWGISREGFSSDLDLLLGKRKFDASYSGRNTRNTAQIRSLTRVAPWGRTLRGDVYYEVSPEQSARLERLFTQVPRGTGNYRYAGDLNGNGIADEADFRQTRFDGDYIRVTVPGEELVPVLNLKSSLRLRTDLSAVGNPEGWSPGDLLAAVSTETYLRVEEKSSDSVRSNIYLVKLGTFRNPSTTLDGSVIFSQDLNFRERDPSFSLKMRFLQKRAFQRLASGDERAYSRERMVRVRWSAAEDLSNQAEIRELATNVEAGESSPRNMAVRSTTVSLEWTYRPVKDIESGFGFSFGDAKNYDSSTASLNAQRLTLSWSLPGNGRLHSEFSREEAVVGGETAFLPYELTMGRTIGKTWIWGFNFEYRLTRFLESSVRYEGRKEQRAGTVHTAGMEVRAFF